MRALNSAEGQVTQSETEMKNLIFHFYQKLYTADEDVAGNKEERDQDLALINQKVSPVDHDKICCIPSEQEIEQVAFGFKLNTSPGLDEVSADVARGCWECFQEVCYAAVQKFWKDHLMAASDLSCVIKLLHKGGDREALTNWKPISLLTLMYKIIAKLLASRIKDVIPEIVDGQQKGFVKGRSIHDIILAYRIGQEYVKATKQKAFFCEI
jgi:hypothetical protein